MQTPKFRFRRLSTLFISAFAAVGLLSGCHHEGRNPEERLNRAMEEITTRLDLTDTQQNKLAEVKDEILKVREKNKGERLKIINELKSMVLSDQLDSMKAKRVFMRKQRLMRKEFDPVFDKIKEFHATLTDEQKEKIVNRLEELENQLRGTEGDVDDVDEDIERVDDDDTDDIDDDDDFR